MVRHGLRGYAFERTLSGPAGPGTPERLVKRRLLAKRIRVESKGAYKTAYIDTDGHKVVGAYIMVTVKPDAPIKSFRRYYGVGAPAQNSADFIRTLANDLIQSRIGQVSVDAGIEEHIYIAQPVEAGLPVLSYGGLEGGFNAPLIVSVPDPVTQSAMDYYLYESVNDHLGKTTIEIE